MMTIRSLTALVLLAACGPDDAPLDTPPVPVPDVEAWAWESCPLYANNPWGKMAECALIPAPLFYDAPDGDKLYVHVQRLRGNGAPSGGQLWLLQGGPGGSGADYDWFMDYWSERYPAWDLYTLDHRGVGRSSRLGCPQEGLSSVDDFDITLDEWPACLASVADTYADTLDAFTLSNAARDLDAVIDATREEGRRTFVFGCSYGTTWAHRYLQLFPDEVDGVILDSLAINIWMSDYHLFFEQVGVDFMQVCAADPTCSGKLGQDPMQSVVALFDSLETGHCPEAELDRPTLRVFLGRLLARWDVRQLIGPIVYRLQRCEPADVVAVHKLFASVMARPFTYHEKLFSPVLHTHIARSEFWPSAPPSPAALGDIVEASHFSFAARGEDEVTFQTFAAASWPASPHDELWTGFATTSVPLLMMNGDLDPQTPLWVAEPVGAHFTAANQYFVTVPGAPHGVFSQTPVRSEGAPPCGMAMMKSFLDDPSQPPDTSCLAELLPIDFVANALYANWYLGADDYWENTPVPASLAPKAAPPRAVPRLPNSERHPY